MFSWADSPGPSRLQRRPGEKPLQEEQRASSDASGTLGRWKHRQADVAQLVEQLIRNQ